MLEFLQYLNRPSFVVIKTLAKPLFNVLGTKYN